MSHNLPAAAATVPKDEGATVTARDAVVTARDARKRRRVEGRAQQLQSLVRTYGPHYETVQLSHKDSQLQVRLQLTPETPRRIVTDEWVLTVARHARTGFAAQLQVAMPHDGHLDWLAKMVRGGHVAADHVFRLFPNAKEITESVAAVQLLRNRLYASGDEPALIIEVGAGTTPRTGALLAAVFRGAAVHSIDPELRAEWVTDGSGAAALTAHRCCVEDWLVGAGAPVLAGLAARPAAAVAVVAVHSHARLENYLPAVGRACGRTRPLVVITMPCCVEQTLSPEQSDELNIHMLFHTVDWGVHSEKRQLFVWGRAPLEVDSPDDENELVCAETFSSD